MFYCDPCAADYNYPSFPEGVQSYGKCEVCGKTAGCNDLPTSILSKLDAGLVGPEEVEEALASIAEAASKIKEKP